MKPADILNTILIEQNLQVQEFADKIGATKGPFYKILNGTTKTISYKTAIKIVQVFPEYDINWILGKVKKDKKYTVEDSQDTVIREHRQDYPKKESIQDQIAEAVYQRLLKKLNLQDKHLNLIAEQLTELHEMVNQILLWEDMKDDLTQDEEEFKEDRNLSRPE